MQGTQQDESGGIVLYKGRFRAGAGGGGKVRRPWETRLTAASYRYFTRGLSEKPSRDDLRVVQPGMKRLAPYDHMLRQFKCVPFAKGGI